MIVLAICVLLIILILANIAMSMFNAVYPPCNTLEEYFKSARVLPRGKLAGLDYAQSKIKAQYVGNELDVIDAMGYDEVKANKETFQKNMENALNQQEDATKSSFYKAVNKIFKSSTPDQGTTEKGISNFSGEQLAMFDLEMEGIATKSLPKRNDTNNGLVRIAERDGYGDRDPNAF
jgi:hypothetical protein